MDTLKSSYPIWVSLAESFRVDPLDIKQFLRRTACEGQSFVLKELPSLGCSFNQTIITGRPFKIEGRFKVRHGTKLPVFLYSLFREVLHKDGALKSNACPLHIKRIRQLLLLYYKLEMPYELSTMGEAIEAFVTRDSELGTSFAHTSLQGTLAGRNRRVLLQRARGLICRVIGSTDPFDITPRHGPGATSCRTRNHSKYHSFRYIEKLNRCFPYERMMFYNYSHLCDNLNDYLKSEEYMAPCSRLVAVPKDLRGPRLICCEPREHQYIQQGLMQLLYNCVEKHPLTAGFVNFTDQTINRDLAMSGSISQEMATIDMKDASDRVRWDLVQELFPGNWVEALDACRTEFVELPNGKTYGPLRKFAPMGSAVCFPIEALVFWALCRSVIDDDVYVYGDDIVLPTHCVQEAMDILESYDLKVNRDKSCYLTPFRESCGIDCYDGFDVSYVKLRQSPKGANDIKTEESMVEFSNQVLIHHGEEAFLKIREIVDTLYGVHFCTLEDIPLSYRCAPRAVNDVCFKRRWSNELQRWEYLLPASCDREKRYNRPAWGEMLRFSLTPMCVPLLSSAVGASTPSEPIMENGQYAVPGCTKRYRWKALYS